MVKPRVKKTTRGEIPQELYEQAAYDVINGNAKVRTTAKKYGMCHISLRRFVIAKKNNKTHKSLMEVGIFLGVLSLGIDYEVKCAYSRGNIAELSFRFLSRPLLLPAACLKMLTMELFPMKRAFMNKNNEVVHYRTESKVPQDEEIDNEITHYTDNGYIEKSASEVVNSSEIAANINSKKTVFCYFCETSVSNFPRHLSRNHKSELEVQKILALPPLSKERKGLLQALRKKGNYLTSNEVVKPVKKGAEDTNYLPCTYCLGFYSARNLWRHRKQCDANPTKETSARNSQTDAQIFYYVT
ncbi:hypothetical protein JTB14_005011 [Gonioctena quinquepunctata]|nr:hypothetical protein JTB14_005011 [Gonioctena quinquepunctata]